MFHNTLTASDNYPVQDIYPVQDNYPVCRPRFKCSYLFNQIIFSDFFIPFLEYTSNFKHFEKKDDSHSYFIWEIRHCERVG